AIKPETVFLSVLITIPKFVTGISFSSTLLVPLQLSVSSLVCPTTAIADNSNKPIAPYLFMTFIPPCLVFYLTLRGFFQRLFSEEMLSSFLDLITGRLIEPAIQVSPSPFSINRASRLLKKPPDKLERI